MARICHIFDVTSDLQNIDKIHTPDTHIHNLSVSWLAADTSIENNNGRLKLLVWAQIYPPSEMMRGHARVFVHVTIMANLTHNLDVSILQV
jgi:hypothetical protein